MNEITRETLAITGGTLATGGIIDMFAHLGPGGLFLAGVAGVVAWRHGGDLVEAVKSVLPSKDETEDEQETEKLPVVSGKRSKRTFVQRTLGIYPSENEPQPKQDRATVEPIEDAFEWDGLDDMPAPKLNAGPFLFSSVLNTFTPSVNHIFLARTVDGLDLYCHAKDLCHVAIAGSTGGGKSSIMRMLMLQLCKSGVQVLMLNPHYTGYDLDNGEDWTPFERYMVHPPMECRKTEVIEHYLKAAAKDLIPNRLERRAHSQPVGKPYFIVIDELPSIIREIEAAPEYMRIILEEGRKVGVFVISAAQDFLVKTIAPKAGGGSIRECYRTAFYVGGDATTARILLDMPANQIPEDELGKGVVMLRATSSKKASQVLVPYVDNKALYSLLGPSTYKPSALLDTEEQELTFPSVSASGNVVNSVYRGMETASQASSSNIINDVFTASTAVKETETDAQNMVLDVPQKTLDSIKRMKKAGYPDREIAGIVGLAGRKYPVYKQCLALLSNEIRKEA